MHGPHLRVLLVNTSLKVMITCINMTCLRKDWASMSVQIELPTHIWKKEVKRETKRKNNFLIVIIKKMMNNNNKWDNKTMVELLEK